MYSTIQEYYKFVHQQRLKKKWEYSKTISSVIEQMDEVMSSHGWIAKKGMPGIYKKAFNHKIITIEFRCKLQDGFDDGGLPEFIHDKSIPDSLEKLQMRHFHWNDHKTSGWSLDVVLERMEKFYNKYTLGI